MGIYALQVELDCLLVLCRPTSGLVTVYCRRAYEWYDLVAEKNISSWDHMR